MPAATKTQNATPYRASKINQIARGTQSSRASVIKLGRLNSRRGKAPGRARAPTAGRTGLPRGPRGPAAPGPPEKLVAALARVGGPRIGMIVHRLAGPIVPHGDVEPGRAAGRAAGHRERDKRLIGAVLLGDLGERRGVTGPRLGRVDHGYI